MSKYNNTTEGMMYIGTYIIISNEMKKKPRYDIYSSIEFGQ